MRVLERFNGLLTTRYSIKVFGHGGPMGAVIARRAGALMPKLDTRVL
jgi:hypothetical protein